MTDKQTVKFGDICREVKLTTKDPIADGYERYIGLEHLDSSSLKIKRWGLITEDNPSFTRVFKKGHILLGKRRPYLKKAAIAEFDGICSGDIIVLEASSSVELLKLIISSNKFWNYAVKTSSGSLSPRTKFKSLEDFELKTPPAPKLEKALAIFEKINSLYINSEKTLESVISFRKSLRVKLLYKGGSNVALKKSHWGYLPEGWEYKPFTEIAEINPKYKVTEAKNIKFCEMALLGTDSKYISGTPELRSPNEGGARFQNGDILFARITPCAENGKMAIVDFLDEHETGKGSTEFIVLSPKSVSSFYLYSLCKTERVRGYAIGNMEGTTGRQRIPAYIFENIMLPIPPSNVMSQIETALMMAEDQVQVSYLKSEKVRSLLTSFADSITEG